MSTAKMSARMRDMLLPAWRLPLIAGLSVASVAGYEQVSGESMPFLGVLLTAIAMAGAVDLARRPALVRIGLRAARRQWQTLAHAGLLLSGALAFGFARAGGSGHGDVDSVLVLFDLLAVFVILAIPAWGMSREPLDMRIVLLRALAAGAAWQCLAWVVERFGPDLYAAVESDPMGALSLVVVGLMLSLVVGFSRRQVRRPVDSFALRGAGYATLGVAQGQPALSEQDRARVAAHEAGHLLVFAAMERLPEGMEALVFERRDKDGNLGGVTDVDMGPNLLGGESVMYWMMCVLLAGRLAEARVFGDPSTGSRNDLERWQRLATEYLGAQASPRIVLSPQTESEVKLNMAELQALAREQEAVLNELFALNRDRYERLCEVLESERKLSRERIEELLAEVELPEGLPRVPALALQGRKN